MYQFLPDYAGCYCECRLEVFGAILFDICKLHDNGMPELIK